MVGFLQCMLRPAPFWEISSWKIACLLQRAGTHASVSTRGCDWPRGALALMVFTWLTQITMCGGYDSQTVVSTEITPGTPQPFDRLEKLAASFRTRWESENSLTSGMAAVSTRTVSCPYIPVRMGQTMLQHLKSTALHLQSLRLNLLLVGRTVGSLLANLSHL